MLLIILLLAFSLASCKQNESNKLKGVITEVGHSDKFSEKEIKEAINTVKDEFDFEGCTLKKVWYEQEKSDYATSAYLGTGKGSINGVEPENIIVVFAEFDVDSKGGDGSFKPNSTYDNWQFILIRDSAKDDWKIDDWGY